MTTLTRITVRASKNYDILMKQGLLGDAAEHIAQIFPPAGSRCCLVCDKTVHALYGQERHPLLQALSGAGYETCTYVFRPGEESKSLDTAADLCRFMEENSLTRNDFVIALGGGVCGDLAGFAASIYMRGIPYVQIPTTLLAMADSSVGGKTGVNTKAGKNMLGTFWQPALVLADPDCLETLSEKQLLNGLAEIVKAAFIADGSIIDAISEGLPQAAAKAVQVKKEIVEADEREAGRRKLLNFGHTIGHAIERCSDYAVPHGYAVMTGMYLTALAAESLGWTDAADQTGRPVSELIRAVMDAFAYPLYTEYPAKALAEAAASDKKRAADSITIVYPDRPGRCTMRELPAGELESFIEAGLKGAEGR